MSENRTSEMRTNGHLDFRNWSLNLAASIDHFIKITSVDHQILNVRNPNWAEIQKEGNLLLAFWAFKPNATSLD